MSIKAKTLIASGLIIVCAWSIYPRTALAQVNGSGSTLSTPRENVKSGSVASRRPGLWVQQAISGGPEITATESQEDIRIVNQILWSLYDAFFELFDLIVQTIIQQISASIAEALNLDPTQGNQNSSTPTPTPTPAPNSADNCPDDPDKTEPGVCGCGVADTDTDEDGISDCNDNCPNIANMDQTDTDSDGAGNECDDDDDDDGILDDGDGDGIIGSTACNPSVVFGCDDNCPETINPLQTDTDNDLIGDRCDNCPQLINFEQLDSDNDNIGDVCDNTPLPPTSP
ncbi:MAG: thrombospondin type 3 repeat-containing protein [Planctomycetota bacterium]